MITVNGKEETCYHGSLMEYLSEKGFKIDRIAVEINENIVAKKNYETTYLSDEDKIEIIHFVGGG